MIEKGKQKGLTLFIDTASDSIIQISIHQNGTILAKKKFQAPRRQAEKLLPAIENLLNKNNFTLKQIGKIEVVTAGGSFTSLRIGVLTANALAFALGVEVCAVSEINQPIPGRLKKSNGVMVAVPEYGREPNIG